MLIINPYNGKKIKKHRPAAELMRRRTCKNEKGYTYSMGYNMISGRYSPGGDYGRFSGSSLNRTLKKQLHHGEAEELYRATKNIIKIAGKAAKYASHARIFLAHLWNIGIIQKDQPDQRQLKDGFSCPLCGRTCGFYVFDLSAKPVHLLSARSRGKVKDKCTAFFRSSPQNRSFVTLTFISPISDSTGVMVLNKFLTALRSEFSDFKFLWVAERQDNGNIHFHMIVNRRLPVARFNPLWVLQQYNAGLVGKNKEGNEISKEEILQRIKDRTVGKVLNPFDIKKVTTIGGLSGYLTKYITKQKKDQGFECLTWHCSRSVSRLFTKAVVSPSAFAAAMSLSNCKIDLETGEVFMPEVIKGDFWLLCYINVKRLPLYYLSEMEQVNKWILNGLLPSQLPMCNDDDYKKFFLNKN